MIPQLQILLLSMAPISELRGAIPIGVAILNLPFWEVFLISICGNLIAVFFVLLFLKYVYQWIEKIAEMRSQKLSFVIKIAVLLRHFFNWLFLRTRKKAKPWIEKYGKLALVLFVAIPLPITGGWTGSIAAFLFGVPFVIAFPLIAIGVLIAGGVVSIFTLSGIAVKECFGWTTLILLVGLVFVCWFVYHIIVKNKKK